MTTLKETFDAIHAAHGYVTPALAVQTLSDPAHPHHDRLTWDDTEAAHKHRLHEAAQLIRSVRVKYREPDDVRPAGTIRAYHAVADSQSPSPVYKSVDAIIAQPLTAELLKRQMERDWLVLKRRYAEFEEFWQLVGQSQAQQAQAPQSPPPPPVQQAQVPSAQPQQVKKAS